jgi:hypothetical protein
MLRERAIRPRRAWSPPTPRSALQERRVRLGVLRTAYLRAIIRFLENCRRALSKDGVLIMSEPCNDNFMIRWARHLMYRFSPHFDLGDQGFTKNGLISLYERAGFEVTYAGRYGVFSYFFAGFPDHFGVLRFVPGNAAMTRWFLKLDRKICATRFLRILSFQVVVVSKPRA